MRLFVVNIALSLIGCASHRVPDHTLLFTPDGQHKVWSYEPVDGEGFVSRPLRPNDRVTLRNGAVVSSDDKALVVNGKEVESLNAVVEFDGKVREGAFIQTFG